MHHANDAREITEIVQSTKTITRFVYEGELFDEDEVTVWLNFCLKVYTKSRNLELFEAVTELLKALTRKKNKSISAHR